MLNLHSISRPGIVFGFVEHLLKLKRHYSATESIKMLSISMAASLILVPGP